MKIEEKLNVKEIIAQSEKNQKKIAVLFDELEGIQLTKKEKKSLNAQLNEMEHLALSIKVKLAK